MITRALNTVTAKKYLGKQVFGNKILNFGTLKVL